MTAVKEYKCVFSDCEEKFTILFEWTSHVRSHASKRYYAGFVVMKQPDEIESPSSASAISGSGIGACPKMGDHRAITPLASIPGTGVGAGANYRSEKGTGAGPGMERAISNNTSSVSMTRDERRAFGAGDIDTAVSTWQQSTRSNSVASLSRSSSVAPIFRTTSKSIATPLLKRENSSTPLHQSIPITSASGTTSHPPTPTKITKVTLKYREHSAAASSATVRSQSGSEPNDRRTPIPSRKRGRSPSSSSASESLSGASIDQQLAFAQDDVDIDMNELCTYDAERDRVPNSTTSAGSTTSTSRTYPAKTHPCVWVERRAGFMLPYILENTPCHRGFDTEAELFAHYAWHIDQLGVDHECEVGTCRMRILSEEHHKSHYQQMHPGLSIPQDIHSIANTAKPARRAGTATKTAAGRGLRSKRLSSGTSRESITPPPPPPPLPPPTKAQTQPKVQQAKISEGWKPKTNGKGSATSTTPYNNVLAKQYTHHTTTQDIPATTTAYSDDDEDDDPTPPMAFGPFFKKK